MQNRIRTLRLAAGLTLEQLAERSGTSFAQISHLETGRRKLTQEWMQRLAKALHCTSSDLIASERMPVKLLGYVGAGAEVFAIDDHAQGAGLDDIDCPPNCDPLNTVAVRVRGDSMLPMLKDGWTLFYSTRVDGGCDDYIGKLCVVQLHGGKVLVKELKKGYTKGRYNLFSYNAELIEDARLDWCAPIEHISLK